LSKTILILGAGIEQIFAIKAAQECKIKVVAVDGDAKAPGLKIADVGINADINNVELLVKLGKQYAVDGVMSPAVEIPVVVANVAKELGLPGIPPETAERAFNKIKRLEAFRDHGVPSPRFAIASSLDDAVKAADKLGLPLVFKPIDNCAARGVIMVEDKNKIERGFETAFSYAKRLKEILIEEYLQGPEFSTESIVSKGRIYTPGFGDRNYDKRQFLPFFIENGGELPTALNEKEKRSVIDVVESAIKALGIKWGVAKGDIIIDRGQPKVLEMAARTSGGRFSTMKIPLSTGVDMIKFLVQMHVGMEPDPKELKPKFSKGIAERFIFPKPGKIIAISGTEEAKRSKGIIDFSMGSQMNIGNIIKNPTNHAERFGYVVAIGDSRKEAIKYAEDAIKMIKIETK